jgi:quercetin dioxygenase-like cupin family protein
VINTRGFSDVYVVHNKIPPGGHTGWHSHPGISFVTVEAGQVTEYNADDPGVPHVFPTGTGFVEEAGRVHIMRNEGTTDLELVAFQIIPFGATRRIDEPAP